MTNHNPKLNIFPWRGLGAQRSDCAKKELIQFWFKLETQCLCHFPVHASRWRPVVIYSKFVLNIAIFENKVVQQIRHKWLTFLRQGLVFEWELIVPPFWLIVICFTMCTILPFYKYIKLR